MNVLVIGKAKSGTTIISKTIQKSCGAEHYHLEKRKVQFFENSRLEQPLVVKLLFEDWSSRPNLLRGVCLNEAAITFNKVVLILRDPRDVLVSLLMFRSAQLLATLPDSQLDAWLSLLWQKEQDPGSIRVSTLYAELGRLTGTSMDLGRLARNFLPWFRFARDMGKRGAHCLKYEDFIGCRLQTLESYLGVPLTDVREVDAYVNTPRTLGVENWKEFFTPQDIAQVNTSIGTHLSSLGYGDSKLAPAGSLKSDFYSGYVLKVVGNIRARSKG